MAIISHCPSCGNSKSHRSLRCKSCYNNDRWGENHPRWNGTKVCPHCGNKKAWHAKQCKPCYNKARNKPRFCKGCGKQWPSDRKVATTGYCQSCYRGDKTRRWNTSLTPEQRLSGKRTINPEYRDWKIQVHIKDSHTCLKCKKKGGRGIIAHHIQNWDRYPDLRYDVQNGATLCKSCHKRFHNLFGNRHNTRQQFEEFVSSKVR